MELVLVGCPLRSDISLELPTTVHRSDVMAISFLPRHSPLVSFTDQPTLVFSRARTPILKTEVRGPTGCQPTPRTTVVLQKLRVRQNGYNLVQKKVTKTVVVVAEYTCIVYLYASDGGTSRSGHAGLCSPAIR